MVLYDIRCENGHRGEVNLPSMHSPNPECGICGEATSRIPALARMSGTASAGPSRDDMPMSWHGIGQGDPQAIRHWHRQMSRREKLEEKYPELAGDRRPVLAHEGQFAAKPLRAGDAEVAAVARAAFGAPGGGDTAGGAAAGGAAAGRTATGGAGKTNRTTTSSDSSTATSTRPSSSAGGTS